MAFNNLLKQVVSPDLSGIRVQTHATLVAALYHQVEKKSFIFSHCWVKLNGKPKWQTVLKEIENNTEKMKKNDGSSSAQSIGLDEEEEVNNGANMQEIMPKRNRQVMGTSGRRTRWRVKARQAKCLPLVHAFFMLMR